MFQNVPNNVFLKVFFAMNRNHSSKKRKRDPDECSLPISFWKLIRQLVVLYCPCKISSITNQKWWRELKSLRIKLLNALWTMLYQFDRHKVVNRKLRELYKKRDLSAWLSTAAEVLIAVLNVDQHEKRRFPLLVLIFY